MARYYCDYCDSRCSNNSSSVRKQHNEGNLHRRNVYAYYAQFIGKDVQDKVDAVIAAFEDKVSRGLVTPTYKTFPPQAPAAAAPAPVAAPGPAQAVTEPEPANETGSSSSSSESSDESDGSEGGAAGDDDVASDDFMLTEITPAAAGATSVKDEGDSASGGEDERPAKRARTSEAVGGSPAASEKREGEPRPAEQTDAAPVVAASENVESSTAPALPDDLAVNQSAEADTPAGSDRNDSDMEMD